TGTNTYAVSYTNAISSYKTGVTYKIKFSSANTGASTLNINGIGVKNIQRKDGSALVAGDLNGIVYLEYVDNVFKIINGVETDATPTSGSTNPVQSGSVYTELQGKEDSFSKNTAFNKDFGTTAGTVAEGNHNHS